MKTKIYSICVALAACIGLTSCGDDTWNKGTQSLTEGEVSLASMRVDVDYDEALVSRAVSTDNFIVEIVDRTTDAVKKNWKYSEMPEVMSLAPGDYTVNVKSHVVQPAEWNAPYYVGTKDFSVEVNKITEIGTVFCKFSNIKVTVGYTQELLSKCADDIKVRVVANDRGALDYTRATTDAGYFEAVTGSSTLAAEFSATVDGNAVNSHTTFTDVKAGQYYIITFGVKGGQATIPDEFGDIAPSGITVDASIQHEDHSGSADHGQGTQDGTTERPGQEEWPDDPEQPGPDEPGEEYITAIPTHLVFNSVMDAEALAQEIGDLESGYAYVTFNVPAKIKKMEVNIYSSEQFLQVLDDEDVAIGSYFDLADPGDKAGPLSGLGLPVGEDVKNNVTVVFDITKFISLLNMYPDTNYEFRVTVTDNLHDDSTPNDGHVRSFSLKFKSKPKPAEL